MRDLIQSVKRGPRAVYESAADFPHRHPFGIAGFCGGLAIVALIFFPGSGLLAQQDAINVTRHQVTTINNAVCRQSVLKHPNSPQAHACAERIRIGLVTCHRLPKCWRGLSGLEVPPEHGRPKGVVIGGGSNPSGQPGGGSPPAHSPSHQDHGKQPQQQGGGQGGSSPGGGASPAPAPEPATSEPAPGRSGEAPGQDEGGGAGQSNETPKGPVQSTVETATSGVQEVTEGAVGAVCGTLEKLEGHCSR
jgi:hypothetical protein